MFTFIFSPLLLQWRKHISTLCMKWDPIFSTFSVPCQLASPVTPTSLSLSLVFVWGALWSSGANLQDLSSSTRDQTSAPYSGSSVLTARPSGNSLFLLPRSVFKHAQVCPVSIPEFHLPS